MVSRSLLFCAQVATLGRCWYNIKNTYRHVALLPFSIGFVLSQELDVIHQMWVEVEGTKLWTNFKYDF